ncbi:MAG TPA: hypothetical protein VLM85_00395 [Polyangiaceae bacterium]|nr:hypothetical protein [Polyangiaceae bacterium]
MLRPRHTLLATLFLVGVGLLACAADPTQPAPPPPADTADAAPPPPPAQTADAVAPPWCPDATGIYTAQKVPGDVLFLMDRSGSMQIKLSNGDTRWADTKTGLFNLLKALPTTTRAGAMMFPQGDAPISCCWISSTLNDVTCSCATGELPGIGVRCDASNYAVPVPVADISPQQVSDIEAYISSSDADFYWGTPLAAALTAAIDRQQASKLDGTKSVVLLTDGYPTSCDSSTDPTANDIQHVVDAAAAGAQAGVRTFVLGVIDGTKGARASYLSPIAEAGGTARTPSCGTTDDCFYALNNATFTQDLQAAFDQIQLQAFDCSFDLPQPQGGAPDLSKINVELQTQQGTQQVMRYTTHQNGWDYLPNQKHLQLYGNACTTLKADVKNQVDVVVGCTTQGH